MPAQLLPAPTDSLTSIAESFEHALSRNPDARLADFLPPGDHPLYVEVVGELVRIDLAHAWERGTPYRLADYRPRFPALFVSPTALAPAALEEFRRRRGRGDVVSPGEYHAAYRVDTRDWPAGDSHTPFPPTARMEGAPLPVAAPTSPHDPRASADGPDDPEAISRWVSLKATLPEPGTVFLGFRLIEELGRGAFGRVYLARQDDLAGRPVALKVACDIAGESRALAQLQHANIVPVYSYHRAGAFQAVCMPYLGRATLADVVRRLGGRKGLPSSGRELRSTVTPNAAVTVPSFGPASSGSRTGLPDREPDRAAPPSLPVERAADGWARLEGLSYVGAVLWLGEQLADGLAHAHARGILHRDLKPANVLLADDGRPMLLDFNLAEDTKLRGPSAERAAIGGTLPYMSPEQICGFRDRAGVLDARSDVYSLGVMLYELLAGRHPFPARRGPARDALPDLLADRRRPAPSVRQWNREVSPAAESIVRKCLAPDPADRYQSAEELREDIDRHLNDLPLRHAPNPSLRERARKWARRHPRLSSSGTVAVVAGVLLAAAVGGVLYARERSRDLHARVTFVDHRDAFAGAQLFLDDRNQSRPRLDESMEKLRGVLARYRVPEDGTGGWLSADDVRRLPEADREKLRADVGETFYLMAQVEHLRALGDEDPDRRGPHLELAAKWNAAAAELAGERLARAVREQQATIAHLGGSAAEAERLRREAARVANDSPRDLFLVGFVLSQQGRHRDALPHLRKSTLLDPRNFSAWFVRGGVHLALGQDDSAQACFTACLALRDDFAPAWLNRGLAQARLRAFDQARDDYDRALVLDPQFAEAYVQRAGVRAAVGDLKGAEADYGRALEIGGTPVRVHFLRAHVREQIGDKAGAKSDREKGLSLTPADELSWVGRAETRLADDPKGALADVGEALKLNPFSVPGLQLKAHILGERLNRADDALAVLDRAVELHPDHVPVRAGRGVELARRGKREEALRDAAEALLRDTRPPNLYQVACIYALTSKTNPEDKREALRLLWAALKTGFALDIVDTDTDLDPLRKDPEFKRVVSAARERAST